MTENILAIIPARGGSKGIPKKNIRPIAGKPLLAYSIEQAWGTPSITRVVVSTDDPEIKAVAQTYRAEVVDRPAEISGDTASSESALLHVLDHLRQQEGYEPDLVVFLQATSPLRQPDDIQRAIDTLRRENADSLLSVTAFHGFVWRIEDGRATSFNYDYQHRPRRQDAPEDVMENGSIYVFKPWVLWEKKNRLGGKIAVHRMSVLDSFQVDEPDDLILIEQLLAIRQQG
jgi:N-acylneuraminate cytidylyltransferase